MKDFQIINYKGVEIKYRTKEKMRNKMKAIDNKEAKQFHILWRNNVFLRDNYTCQLCNKYLKDGNPKNMQPHHILAKETYPDLKFCVMNGITLCYYCHNNSDSSPHLNALVFALFLQKNKPEQFAYLVSALENMKKQPI